jgi:hypothetical protein
VVTAQQLAEAAMHDYLGQQQQQQQQQQKHIWWGPERAL